MIGLSVIDVVVLLVILGANVWLFKYEEKKEREKFEFLFNDMKKNGVTDFARIKEIYYKNDRIQNKRRGIE